MLSGQHSLYASRLLLDHTMLVGASWFEISREDEGSSGSRDQSAARNLRPTARMWEYSMHVAGRQMVFVTNNGGLKSNVK
jgi:hypothetical protein